MAKSWGSTKGNTTSDKLDYLKFKNGKQTVRVVSGVEARYCYWPVNKDAKTAPFDCLRFDRDTERFLQGAKDPIQDLGLKDKAGEPLKCKKNYVCWVIDRADNKLKIMTVKDGILKGIQSVMQQLKLDDPSVIDLVITRSGTTWNNTEYKIEEIAAYQFKQAIDNPNSPESQLHKADLEILGEDMQNVKDLREVFPIPSYDEQLQSVTAFMEGRKEKEEDKSGTDSTANDAEAASDLDD